MAYSGAAFYALGAYTAGLLAVTSHAMHLENPNALNAGLLRFLAEVTERDA